MFKQFRKGGPARQFKPKEGERWICSKCGQDIESLPFIPSKKDAPIYHRECLPPRN